MNGYVYVDEYAYAYMCMCMLSNMFACTRKVHVCVCACALARAGMHLPISQSVPTTHVSLLQTHACLHMDRSRSRPRLSAFRPCSSEEVRAIAIE